jgi:hypothetical protein
MTSVFLIVSNNNPSQLFRLIDSLSFANNIFIVHVDNLTSLKPFTKLFSNFFKGKVFFCPDRINMNNGKICEAKATCSLINYLNQLSLTFDYLHLIHGQDYPIKTSSDFQSFFSKNYGRSFIEYFPICNSLDGEPLKINIDKICENPNIIERFTRGNFSCDMDSFKAFGGSIFFSIHKDCFQMVFNKFIEEDFIDSFYELYPIPRLSLFQTLIMNSRLASSIENFNLRYRVQNNASFVFENHFLNLNDCLAKNNVFFYGKIDLMDYEKVQKVIDNSKNNLNPFIPSEKVPIDKAIKPRWCVISAVGETSLHRQWINSDTDFDLHLIVYDESYERYKNDSKYVVRSKGYKFFLIYEYLISHPEFIDCYDYFYLPDDDIDIDVSNIHRLFRYMIEYQLEIAQPALVQSQYTFPHTLKSPYSFLRFTNFVEVMQPCFSKTALQKVLFTFNENKSGWGIDYHWGTLINFNKYNMAIIDDVISIHSRPVQSNHQKDFDDYINKYKLTPFVTELK